MGKNGKNQKQPEELMIACPHCGREQDKSRTTCVDCKKFLELSRNESIQKAIIQEVDKYVLAIAGKDVAMWSKIADGIKAREKEARRQ